MLISSAVPLNMPFGQMMLFCSVGFLVVMLVLAALCICTSLIGRIFMAMEKK